MKEYTFLPEDYHLLKKESPYWNFHEQPEGKYKIRILDRPIGGWVEWKTIRDENGEERKSPIRYRPKEGKILSRKKDLQRFWAVPIWNYTTEQLYLWNLTQNSIIKKLEEYGLDEDYGDFREYDIIVRKKTENNKRIYSVDALLPKKPVDALILEQYKANPMNLYALYESSNPFDTHEEKQIAEEDRVSIEKSPVSHLSTENIITLEDRIQQEGLNLEKLEEFMQKIAQDKKKDVEEIRQSFQDPDNYDLVIKHYQKYIGV